MVAQGGPPAEGRHGGVRTHLTVALILVACTLLAFGAVGGGVLPRTALYALLAVLAALQIGLQAAYYMHLRWQRPLLTTVFVGAALLAGFIAWVTWWLLAYHLSRS